MAFAYCFYPSVAQLLAKYGARSVEFSDTYTPASAVVLVVHNEEKRLSARLENLFGSDYPPDKLHVVVVDDGSSDGTERLFFSTTL